MHFLNFSLTLPEMTSALAPLPGATSVTRESLPMF
jgi:hypothetical protein